MSRTARASGFLLCAFYFSLMSSSAVGFGLNSGGQTSIHRFDTKAFSQPAANMTLERRLDFHVGNSFFRNPWVVAPASTTARDGLGPLFNTNACQNCHIRDGRGHPPLDANDNAVSMIVRMGVMPRDAKEIEVVRTRGVIAHARYGAQLQDFSVPGLAPEARIGLTYERHNVLLPDGERVELQKPRLQLQNLAYGEVDTQVAFSVRVAPPLIGLGLLEAWPEGEILSRVDPDDRDGNGISGRANRVWDIEKGQMALGRFGWKAEQPSLRQQNAAAFAGDMGITSTLFPTPECAVTQDKCVALAKRDRPQTQSMAGEAVELSEEILKAVTFYSANLAVPARRQIALPSVKKGQAVFLEAQCHLCHIPEGKTPVLPDRPEQSAQTIHAFTDLLLHDMGPGLADDLAVFDAEGTEWRTPALWGIGLTQTVAGTANYLHDGRARTLFEAVLWHGGEAQRSRDFVAGASKEDREALLAFLQSL